MATGMLAGRGLDNRVGAWAILDALRELATADRPALDIWAVATVQEEIGYFGAKTAAHHVRPDVALVVDVWHANDFPDGSSAHLRSLPAGQRSHDRARRRHSSARRRHVGNRRERAEHPLATRTPWAARPATTATPSRTRALASRLGSLEIPDRYMHSPSETISLADLDNVARLSAAFARQLSADSSWLR